MSAALKRGCCGQAACGLWVGGGVYGEQHNMTLDHGHCLTQVSPSRCRWAGASRGLNRLWLRPPCLQGRVSGDVGGRGSGGKAGSVGAHLARGALPALPGSSRKTGVLVAEKIDSEENPCCPLAAAGTDERGWLPRTVVGGCHPHQSGCPDGVTCRGLLQLVIKKHVDFLSIKSPYWFK